MAPMMTGFDWGMGLGGWPGRVLATVLLVLIVWALVSALGGRDRTLTDDAGQILLSRFARGEIPEQEYEQARRLLGVKLRRRHHGIEANRPHRRRHPRPAGRNGRPGRCPGPDTGRPTGHERRERHDERR